MADYDVFREQLSIKYSTYGHALWEPSPAKPNNPVNVGDVGFIRSGKFHRLFNVLLSAEDQSYVPEHYEQLVPKFSDHISKGTLSANHYCSDGICVELEPNFLASSPDDFERVSFSNSRKRGAVLSLPVDARREDTLAKGDFSGWIVKHIDRWFAFARGLGLGIERMEEIILVTGCDHTRSWTNVAFLGSQHNTHAAFGVKVVHGPAISINWQPSPERVQGAVLHRGPGGTNLPEDQCVFIRGFRVARTFWILPKHLKAAAGPSPDVEGYDCEPDIEVVSIPATPKDPLYLLQDYVAERAPDCDMVLVHDGDLVTINELNHGASPETLEPDEVMDLLRRSNIEIHRISYDLSSTNNGLSTERSMVKVAMLSTTFQNWNTTSPFQWSPLSAQNIDLSYTNESRESSPPAVPGSLPVPTIRGTTSKHESTLPEDHGDSAPSTPQDFKLADRTLGGLEHAAEDILLALSKIRRSPSNADSLLTVVVVTCCVVSLLGWVFSFTWDVIFKLFFTLLLASIPLSAWLEREYRYRRRLDDMYERLEARVEALQHHVATLQLNPAVPAVVADVRYSLPIVARAIPVNPDILGQSNMEGTIQPAIPGGMRGTNDSNGASVVGDAGPALPISAMGPLLEPVAPLGVSANRWVATSAGRSGPGVDGKSPEIVERKVKGLLNKLTIERFDSISDQIIVWANKSEREKDGWTLIQVTKLIFEKATDEEMFSEMYARLCRKMMEQISPNVQDDDIKNAEGKPLAGGHLFRKYLLNRCQEDFERWVAKVTITAAAVTGATQDQAVREANEKTNGGEESELYSDEYYAAAKAKRRGLGLIRFIGELFKMQMLTERIMHECIKVLLSNVENPEEEETESLCMFLTTVGSLLDTQKARAHLDVYFSRMRVLTKNKNVNARMKFLLQDVIDLRERRWIPRNAVAAPTTIPQVHEVAVKERLAQENNAYMPQNASMAQGGSHRGDDTEAPHPDGWSIADSGTPPRQLATPEGNTSDMSEESIIDLGDGGTKV